LIPDITFLGSERRIGWFTLTSITPTVPKLHVLIPIYSSQDVIMPPNTFMSSLIFNSISLTPIWYLFKLQPTNYPTHFSIGSPLPLLKFAPLECISQMAIFNKITTAM
jgi:hypothetical protein